MTKFSEKIGLKVLSPLAGLFPAQIPIECVLTCAPAWVLCVSDILKRAVQSSYLFFLAPQAPVVPPSGTPSGNYVFT